MNKFIMFEFPLTDKNLINVKTTHPITVEMLKSIAKSLFRIFSFPIFNVKSNTIEYKKRGKTIKTAKFDYIFEFDDLEKKADEIGFPLLLKPLMSSSGKGQSLVETKNEIKKGWEKGQEKTKGKGRGKG